MELDRTLIDKDGVPTVEELKEFFRNNDYTAMKSTFDPSCLQPDLLEAYKKAQGFFKDKWLDILKSLGGKGSFKNFSENYPLQILEQADQDIVTGIVGEILTDRELANRIMNSFFVIAAKPFAEECAAYCDSSQKTPDELTLEDIMKITDKVADDFLAKMVRLMMISQNVPEILGVTRKNGAHEDFNTKVAENHDKIDFNRKWDHVRTELGKPLSLDYIVKSNPSALKESKNFFGSSDESYDVWERLFLNSLDDTDRTIYLMRKQGCTLKEIAERLGYKTHSAVSKRMEKMKQELLNFLPKYCN